MNSLRLKERTGSFVVAEVHKGVSVPSNTSVTSGQDTEEPDTIPTSNVIEESGSNPSGYTVGDRKPSNVIEESGPSPIVCSMDGGCSHVAQQSRSCPTGHPMDDRRSPSASSDIGPSDSQISSVTVTDPTDVTTAPVLRYGGSQSSEADANISDIELPQEPSRSELGIPRRDHLYKVLVIGEFGVGKTSIIRRYTEGIFSPNYKVTIGVDFALKVTNWDVRTRISLQLWDIAGHERFGHMTSVYYKHAIGAIIVFDLTRPATLDAVTKWLGDLHSKVTLTEDIPIPCLLMANKCDVIGAEIDTQMLNEFCRLNGLLTWFPTSARENINIEEGMDYLTHHIMALTMTDDSDLYDQMSLHMTSRNKDIRIAATESEVRPVSGCCRR